VGHTIYDKDCKIVEEYACNPWGSHPRSLCSKPDDSPIRINDSSSRGKAEDLISQLLPPYSELRDPLHLKDALWLYWIARDMPVGTNLPVLAASVEAIMNGWFKSNRTRSRGVYMDKEKFDKLLCDEMSIIEKKLESEPHVDEVMNRLQDAFRMGVMDSFRFFFNEINLVINETEWKAINARHAVAHGRIASNQGEWDQMIQYTNTYETLIHKILLRLLGYSGSYIDRSVIGCKDKQLV